MTLFKYFRLFLFSILLTLASNPSSWAADAQFSWLPNDASDGTVGYKLHYGTSSRSYSKTVDIGCPDPVGGRIYASVSQLAAEQTYYFAVTACNANGTESSYSTEVVKTMPSDVVPAYALRINAGGGKYTDGSGNVWAADTGYNTGKTALKSVAIANTTDDLLYQTQRWDDSTGSELKYSLGVPDGDYVVNLYFAENYNGAFTQNGRVFDILLQGKTVEYKLDVYSEAGANTAHVKSYQATVTNGQLNVEFHHSIENPTIAAIEVLSVATGTASNSSTGTTTSTSGSDSTTTSGGSSTTSTTTGTTSGSSSSSTGTDSTNTADGAIRINAGGGKYTDGDGNVWAADYGYNTGVAASKSVAINDTTDDILFQTQRYDNADGQELKYSVNVPDGNYVVNLYFAENYSGAFKANGRVFDIVLEGSTVEKNLDIYSEAGKNTAFMLSYDAKVTDGKLDIGFLHNIENPTVAAIEILPAMTAAAPQVALRVNAGGSKYTDGDGNEWAADYGYNTGVTAVKSVSINNTTDDVLFQTQRYDNAGGQELNYAFSVPNGNYVVNLYFAENYSGAFKTNGRVFDIVLEGSTVEHNLDIYSEAGKNTAHMISYNAAVADGQLDLGFIHGIENPTIAAIEILSE